MGSNIQTFGDIHKPKTYKEVSTADELNALLNYRYKGTNIVDSDLLSSIIESTLDLFACTFKHTEKESRYLLGIKMFSVNSVEDPSEVVAYPKVSVLYYQDEHGMRKITDIDKESIPVHILEAYTKLIRLCVLWRTKGDMPFDDVNIDNFIRKTYYDN